jgi:hypothetical protein
LTERRFYSLESRKLSRKRSNRGRRRGKNLSYCISGPLTSTEENVEAYNWHVLQNFLHTCLFLSISTVRND